nr:hypothetical protein [Tanacetum cinerariifolium]
ITANIREAPYYQEYQENVAKNRGFLAGETRSTQDLPAPKPGKPARKPQSTTQKAPLKHSISSPVTSTQPAPTSVPAKTQENERKQATGTTDKPAKAKRIKRSASRKTHQPKSSPKSMGESEAEEVPAEELQVIDEDADFQKAIEESMKDAYALPKGPLPPVVIRELESGKYQPLPEMPGKGKAKVSEEQVAYDLLSLQKHKKTSPVDQYIFQRRVSEPTTSSFHDESPYEVLGQSDSEEESKKIVLGVEKGSQDEGQAGPDPNVKAKGQTRSDTGAQAEGQAGSNPDETSEGQVGSNPDETSKGQAGPDPSNAEARVQSTSSPVVHAGSDREHMDLDVANVSPQPSTKQLYKGFTATVYPNVQETLQLTVEEPVFDKPTDADKSAETKVESMVNVPIQQALSSISLMTSPIIDLTSRPESPKEYQQLKATTTDTTTTTTTTLPPPQAPQQSTTEAMMVKRISELEHTMANLIQVNKTIEERLDKHGARLYTLEQLDIPQQEKGHESPKTPPGSPSHQPPPPPPPAGPSGTSGAPRASGSQVTPPPPPPTSTNQDSPSKGLAVPSLAKMTATTKPQAWSTPDVTLKPVVSLTPEDLDMDEAMGPDEQAQLSDEEDIRSAHILTVNLRQGWWKPFEEDRPTTPKPAWSIRSYDVPVPTNNWASTLASNYSPLLKTRYSMDDPILRHNVSKSLPLGGPPGQVTIQSDFFFNKDLEYLRYGSKGRRPALSISKMKAAYYPDAGLEQMVPDQFWIEDECKYDIAAMYGISHWWFQRQRFYIDRRTSEGDRSTVRTYMRILSVVRIEVFSMCGYDYMKKIVLRHLNHLPPKDKKILTTAVNQWTRQLVIRQRVEDFQLRIESYQTQQIVEALDYRVKEFRINMMNLCLNTRFWTRKDVDWCNAFMFAIQRRLRTRRIFRNLESFVGGRLRKGDYRLLRRTD